MHYAVIRIQNKKKTTQTAQPVNPRRLEASFTRVERIVNVDTPN